MRNSLTWGLSFNVFVLIQEFVALGSTFFLPTFFFFLGKSSSPFLTILFKIDNTIMSSWWDSQWNESECEYRRILLIDTISSVEC